MLEAESCASTHDAIVVGAGFAGLYALLRLRNLGLSTVVLERGEDVGGTWFWNRYPGARCDVESLQYSYSFSDELQQEWSWSERFASQGEILRYINYVADRFDLRRDITLNTSVVRAHYDDASGLWDIASADGRAYRARYLVFATGCLSVPVEPQIDGLDAFQGRILRTSTWPKDGVDFAGKRVAIIGTGSSGIQCTPVIAEQADHLFVLQRTPNYSVPGRNQPMDPGFERDWKKNYREHRLAALATRSNNLFDAGTVPGRQVPFEEREREFKRRWQTGGLGFVYAYPDMTSDPEVNKHATDFVHRKIAEKIRNADIAARLVPTEYPIGGRRLCVDNGYYETFNRGNVTLVDLRTEPLLGMTRNGFRTEGGEHVIDMLVLATGFDAFTGALSRIDVRGRNGLALNEKWADGPANYLGICVSGFPNMFMITGPGSPSVLSNVVLAIEHHVDWIADCIAHARAKRAMAIEANSDAEVEWVNKVAALAQGTLISKTKSWYTGANVAGKTNKYFLYMGGIPAYVRELQQAGPDNDYPGLRIA